MQVANQPVIYCDIDGVLCDFWSAANDISPYPIETLSVGEFWKIVADHPNFWSNLNQLQGAGELWEFDESRGGHILSSLPYSDPDSGPGKLKWLEKNFQFTDTKRTHLTTRRRDKRRYAMTNGIVNILIDDYEKNIREWEDSCGISILHSKFRKTLQILESIPKE